MRMSEERLRIINEMRFTGSAQERSACIGELLVELRAERQYAEACEQKLDQASRGEKFLNISVQEAEKALEREKAKVEELKAVLRRTRHARGCGVLSDGECACGRNAALAATEEGE